MTRILRIFVYLIAAFTITFDVNAELEFDVPDESENPYYGRTAFLWNVTEALQSKGAAAIIGVSEVGKTAAVLQLFYSPLFKSARIYDNYIWIDAESEESLKKSIFRLAISPGAKPPDTLTLSESKQLAKKIYLDLLSKNEKTLIIFDNAYKKITSAGKSSLNKDQAVTSILEFLPSAVIPSSSLSSLSSLSTSSASSSVKNNIHVIITSRDVYAGWGENVKVFHLDIMTLDEVIKILYQELKLKGGREPDQEIVDLAKYFENKLPNSLKYPLEYLKKYTSGKTREELLAFIAEYSKDMGMMFELRKNKFGKGEESHSFWHDYDYDKMSDDFREDRDHETIINSLKESYQKAREKSKSNLHDDDHESEETIKIVEKLAEAYFYAKDYENYAIFQEKLLAYMKQKWGSDHQKTLDVQHTLGGVYTLKGEPKTALTLLDPVYQSRKELYGPTHPKTLSTFETIIKILPELNLYERALNDTRTLYNIRKDQLGPEHPMTLFTLHDLAQLYIHFDQFERALEIHQSVYETRRRVLGEEHKETLNSLAGISSVLMYLQRFDEALEYNNELLELTRKVAGEKDVRTLMAMNQVAINLVEVQQVETAFKLNEQASQYAKETLGEDHKITKLIQGVQEILMQKKKEEAVEFGQKEEL